MKAQKQAPIKNIVQSMQNSHTLIVISELGLKYCAGKAKTKMGNYSRYFVRNDWPINHLAYS